MWYSHTMECYPSKEKTTVTCNILGELLKYYTGQKKPETKTMYHILPLIRQLQKKLNYKLSANLWKVRVTENGQNVTLEGDENALKLDCSNSCLIVNLLKQINQYL